ncbi:MAG: hypothetical protein HWD84_10495 [Flavobacteriaceae bacterium]|nr:hypothetical protein [Flavobacteriaceae bacterium]
MSDEERDVGRFTILNREEMTLPDPENRYWQYIFEKTIETGELIRSKVFVRPNGTVQVWKDEYDNYRVIEEMLIDGWLPIADVDNSEEQSAMAEKRPIKWRENNELYCHFLKDKT